MNLHTKPQQGVQGYKLAFFFGCRFRLVNMYLGRRVCTSSETLATRIRCGVDLVWQLDTK